MITPVKDSAKQGDPVLDVIEESVKEHEEKSKTAVASNIQISSPKKKNVEKQKVKEAMQEVKDAVKDLGKISEVAEEPTKKKSIRSLVSESTTVPDLEKQITKIAEKVPIIDQLEGKIYEINKLDPKLKKLSSDLNDLGDFSDFEAAKVGGETIKSIYSASKVANPFVKARLMDTAQAIGKVKLDAIYGREKAAETVKPKEEEASQAEIYSKVFEVM